MRTKSDTRLIYNSPKNGTLLLIPLLSRTKFNSERSTDPNIVIFNYLNMSLNYY
jgi:hypothetical protein